MNDLPAGHRVQMTSSAAALLRELKERYGPVLFHQSGGCCDGGVPLCLRQNEFRIGARDVLLDVVEGVPFYVDHILFQYLHDEQLTLDAVPAISDSFSLESSEDMRFVSRSSSCTCAPEISSAAGDERQ